MVRAQARGLTRIGTLVFVQVEQLIVSILVVSTSEKYENIVSACISACSRRERIIYLIFPSLQKTNAELLISLHTER
jgi:hypothetical protein